MKSILFLTVLFFPLILFSQSKTKEHNFRNADWGMSRKEVIKSEKIKLENVEGTLTGSTTIAKMPVTVCFKFINDSLSEAFYMFNAEHSNNNKYIDDFNEVKNILNKKYGEPSLDKIIWSNDLYKDNPSAWGLAVSMGYLSYASGWLTDESRILLHLSGDNLTISMVTIYMSRKFEDRSVSEDEEETAKDF